MFLFRSLLRATILYVSSKYRNRGKRGRKSNGTRVQDARKYHECGKRTLYETPLYTRRCIRIHVMCTTRSLARVYSPRSRLRVGKRNPRFGSPYRRQRVGPRRWEIYESDLFITLRLQSTFASSAEITEVSRSNADQTLRPELVLQAVVVEVVAGYDSEYDSS